MFFFLNYHIYSMVINFNYIIIYEISDVIFLDFELFP